MSTDQSSTAGEQFPRLRIAIAGGGICGGLLATQLRRSNLFDVCCFEKTPHTGGPPGVNLLLNHNGIAAIKDHDKDLYERLAAVGFEMKTWAALTMTGTCLFSENVVESGLADSAGLRARWDHFVAAIRAASEDGEDGIIYDATVESFRYLESGSVAVTILKNTISGVLTIYLYFMDLISDYQVSVGGRSVTGPMPRGRGWELTD